MIRNLILVLVLAGLAMAAGVRVHPDAVPGYFQFFHSRYVRLDLKSGNFTVGELVREKELYYQVKMGSLDRIFQKSDVLKITPLSYAVLHSDDYKVWSNQNVKKPFLTHRLEDSIVPAFKKGSVDFLSSVFQETLKKTREEKSADDQEPGGNYLQGKELESLLKQRGSRDDKL